MRPALGGHAPASPDGLGPVAGRGFRRRRRRRMPGGARSHAGGGRSLRTPRRPGGVLASLRRGPARAPSRPPRSAIDAVAYQQAWMRALIASGRRRRRSSASAKTVTRERPAGGARSRATSARRRRPRRRRDLGTPDGGRPGRTRTRSSASPAPCMGPCQARRCREQVALILASASDVSPPTVPLAGYRAPVRPLPLKVLADWDEAPAMADGWDVWFGIPGQWTPYADIGTEREVAHPRPRRRGLSRAAGGENRRRGHRRSAAASPGSRRRLVAGAVRRRRAGARQGRRRLGGVGPQRRRRLALPQPAVPRGAAAMAADGRAARLSHRIPARAGDLRPHRTAIWRHYRQHGRRCAAAWAIASTTSTPPQVRELVPLAGDNVSAASTCRFGGQANPQRTVQAYAWALQDLGGRIPQHAPVHRASSTPGGAGHRRRDAARALRLRRPGGRRRAADRHACWPRSACACRWRRPAPR